MASGGIRYDFTVEDGFTAGGFDGSIEFPGTDGRGDPLLSFDGWEVDFYLLRDADDDLGEAIAHMDETGAIDLSEPPAPVMTVARADFAATVARRYWYELWRTDDGHYSRLAYGWMPFID